MPCLCMMSRKILKGLIWLYIFSTGLFVVSLEPGYLDFDNLPDTNFSCVGKVIGGYYADLETNCQMFHVCTIGQLDEPMDIRFLCLNGTVFDQETRVCERIDEVDCSKSEKFYSLNLELYGNTAPPILEENADTESPVVGTSTTTTTTSTTTTPRPTTASTTRPPQYYTSSLRPSTPSPYHKGPSSNQFSLRGPPTSEYTPEEINISLNPGAPPNIRTKQFEFPQHSYSDNVDSNNRKVVVTTHGSVFKSFNNDKQSVNSGIHSSSTTTENAKINYNENVQSPRPNNFNFNFKYNDEGGSADFESLGPHNYHYQSDIANLRPPGLSGHSYSNNPYRSSTHRNEYLPVTRNSFEGNRPSSTARSFYLQPIKSPSHQYFTRAAKPERDQLPIPVLPTLSPIVFSSPAPFALSRHIENKRYTDEHELPPRIIISASASVSDASGRTLNYSLGTIGAAQILAQPPSSYDEYKEDDVVLDPFYHDVPKVKTKNKRTKRDTRAKRFPQNINPSDIIKSEDEAIEVLKFLFDWYKNHEKTTKPPIISIPVSPEVISNINEEFSQKPHSLEDFYSDEQGQTLERNPTFNTQPGQSSNEFGNYEEDYSTQQEFSNVRNKPYRRYQTSPGPVGGHLLNQDHVHSTSQQNRQRPYRGRHRFTIPVSTTENPGNYERYNGDTGTKSILEQSENTPSQVEQYQFNIEKNEQPTRRRFDEHQEFQTLNEKLVPPPIDSRRQSNRNSFGNKKVSKTTDYNRQGEVNYYDQKEYTEQLSPYYGHEPKEYVQQKEVLGENENNKYTTPTENIENQFELRRTAVTDENIGSTTFERNNVIESTTATNFGDDDSGKITTIMKKITENPIHQSKTELSTVTENVQVDTTEIQHNAVLQKETQSEFENTISNSTNDGSQALNNDLELNREESQKTTSFLQDHTESTEYIDTYDYINDNYEPETYFNHNDKNQQGVLHEETNIDIDFPETSTFTSTTTNNPNPIESYDHETPKKNMDITDPPKTFSPEDVTTQKPRKFKYVDENMSSFSDILKSLRDFQKYEEYIHDTAKSEKESNSLSPDKIVEIQTTENINIEEGSKETIDEFTTEPRNSSENTQTKLSTEEARLYTSKPLDDSNSITNTYSTDVKTFETTLGPKLKTVSPSEQTTIPLETTLFDDSETHPFSLTTTPKQEDIVTVPITPRSRIRGRTRNYHDSTRRIENRPDYGYSTYSNRSSGRRRNNRVRHQNRPQPQTTTIFTTSNEVIESLENEEINSELKKSTNTELYTNPVVHLTTSSRGVSTDATTNNAEYKKSKGFFITKTFTTSPPVIEDNSVDFSTTEDIKYYSTTMAPYTVEEPTLGYTSSTDNKELIEETLTPVSTTESIDEESYKSTSKYWTRDHITYTESTTPTSFSSSDPTAYTTEPSVTTTDSSDKTTDPVPQTTDSSETSSTQSTESYEADNALHTTSFKNLMQTIEYIEKTTNSTALPGEALNLFVENNEHLGSTIDDMEQTTKSIVVTKLPETTTEELIPNTEYTTTMSPEHYLTTTEKEIIETTTLLSNTASTLEASEQTTIIPITKIEVVTQTSEDNGSKSSHHEETPKFSENEVGKEKSEGAGRYQFNGRTKQRLPKRTKSPSYRRFSSRHRFSTNNVTPRTEYKSSSEILNFGRHRFSTSNVTPRNRYTEEFNTHLVTSTSSEEIITTTGAPPVTENIDITEENSSTVSNASDSSVVDLNSGKHRFSVLNQDFSTKSTITDQKFTNTDSYLPKNVKPTQGDSKRKLSASTTPLSMLYRVNLRKERVNKMFIFNCFGKPLNRFYSDPRDCRLFHYCTMGYTKNQLLDMKFVCDFGTHFDDEKLVCTKELPKRCL